MSRQVCLASLVLALALTVATAISAASDPPAEEAPAAARPLAPTLAAPQWVSAVTSMGKVRLTWIPNPDFSAVRIYRRTAEEGGAFSTVAEVRENSFLDGTVAPGTVYLYRLVGVGRTGREGWPSVEMKLRIPAVVLKPATPPVWEGSLALENGVGLKWAAGEGEDVIAFNIYRRSPPDTKFHLIGSSRIPSFRDVGLAPGRNYVYALTALDAEFRETRLSRELAVTFAPPPAREEAGKEAVWRVRRTRLITLVSGGDVPFERPSDVAVGPVTGSVYVADSALGRVFVFSAQGAYQRTIGVGLDGASVFRNVLGLGMDRSETLYAVDAGAAAVQTFPLQGHPGRRVGIQPPAGSRATGIVDAAIGQDGGMYVVDNFNNRVLRIARDGVLGPFGQRGFAGGEFSAPTLCDVDEQGAFYVADALNARIQVFTPEGTFVRAFGRSGRGPGEFGRPKGVAVSPAGEVYVADSWLNTVQVFDPTGRFVALLGDEQGRPLDLGSPNGVALGPGRRIFVAERLAARLQIREILDVP